MAMPGDPRPVDPAHVPVDARRPWGREPVASGLPSEPESILAEAERIVDGPRQEHYGPPTDNFARVAGMWSAYLGVEVSPVDVCALMILLKQARIRSGGGYHRDSAVDTAGYARCQQIVGE